MAIPISWPSSEDVEDSYCSLDLLLEQLLVTVRQVLIQRRRQQVLSTLPQRQRAPVSAAPQIPSTQQIPAESVSSRTSVAAPHPRLPLPDLVPDMGECEGPRPRKAPLSPATAVPASTPSAWVQAGAELRHIADAFQAERHSDQNAVDGKSARLEEVSLLSALCPLLGSSLWTTVALLVGWGLFSRTR